MVRLTLHNNDIWAVFLLSGSRLTSFLHSQGSSGVVGWFLERRNIMDLSAKRRRRGAIKIYVPRSKKAPGLTSI